MTEIGVQSTDTSGIGRLADLISGDTSNRLDADMQHVLDTLASLGARPLEYATPASARRQPKLSDAVERLLARTSRSATDDGLETEEITVRGAEGELPARVYRPSGLVNRLNPVVLYFHGGGFITGDLESHDASARALALRTGAIVVSPAYRLAPEHRFPAAHEDAWAIWKWLGDHLSDLNGDQGRIALAGEDAGANLACNIALRARREGSLRPVHQLLIHPMAGTNLGTPSYNATVRTRPIGAPAMRWRFRHWLENADDAEDPRIDLVDRDDLAGLAPATLILAGLDPLRSEGEFLAEMLQEASVRTQCLVYEGVTQGFFGLGLIVTKALFAQADAAHALAKAFSFRGN